MFIYAACAGPMPLGNLPPLLLCPHSPPSIPTL